MPKVVTVLDAAEALAVRKGRVYVLISQGKLEAIKLGRRTVRIKLASLNKLLREGAAQSETQNGGTP